MSLRSFTILRTYGGPDLKRKGNEKDHKLWSRLQKKKHHKGHLKSFRLTLATSKCDLGLCDMLHTRPSGAPCVKAKEDTVAEGQGHMFAKTFTNMPLSVWDKVQGETGN